MLKENDIHWFPMRIRNSSLVRLEEMQKRLNAQDGIERTYAPLRFMKVRDDKMDYANYLLNYIFVRSSFSELVRVKSLFEPLRFVMHPDYDENYNIHHEVL